MPSLELEFEGLGLTGSISTKVNDFLAALVL